MTTSFSVKAKNNSFLMADNTMDVMVRKSVSGLGFSFMITPLDAPGNFGSIVQIKRLFPGQPAEECGLIQEGDIILAVNGQPLKELSYQKVLHLLRGVQSDVRLTLCRPAPGAFTNSNHARSPVSGVRETRSKSLDVQRNDVGLRRGAGFSKQRAQDMAPR
ncbi:hypothetical protein AAFF_G00332740 [Aldrovandia affinis]|uniref:PDZ domain-containing protein n=1 Tax=Aldrovandia affinis TaxID=143900 RepID=A0AAD7SMS1_9TELE|nr:hypothetical protein AAFF_G00332740 [Aldrovandia affinis]